MRSFGLEADRLGLLPRRVLLGEVIVSGERRRALRRDGSSSMGAVDALRSTDSAARQRFSMGRSPVGGAAGSTA